MSLRTPSFATYQATGVNELRFTDASGRICCKTRDKNPAHLCAACASEFARLRESVAGPDPAPTLEALLAGARAPVAAATPSDAHHADPPPTFEALLADQVQRGLR
jgi:hypothetical protein